jgi:hypothetical protein
MIVQLALLTPGGQTGDAIGVFVAPTSMIAADAAVANAAAPSVAAAPMVSNAAHLRQVAIERFTIAYSNTTPCTKSRSQRYTTSPPGLLSGSL